MGKVHDKTQGKLKKALRVTLITSVSALALVVATLGGLKAYDEISSRINSGNKVERVEGQNEQQQVENFEEITVEEEDERKEEEAEAQENIEQDVQEAINGDGPKLVNVEPVAEKTDVHEEVVDGEVVSTTETTTTIYEEVNQGEQYVAVESVVKDGEGNVISEKTIVADPQGNITEDTTLQVATQEGDVELVNGSALETAEEAEVAQSESSLVQEMLDGIESTKTAEEVEVAQSENSLVQEMLDGIENTKTAEETVEEVQAEVVNPIDQNADGYKNFMFKFSASNPKSTEEQILGMTVLNNLPQMPEEVQETINDPDTAITFGEIKPVGFELGGQALISPAKGNGVIIPSVGMIFYNMRTGDAVASLRFNAGFNTNNNYEKFSGAEVIGTLALGKLSVSAAAGIDANYDPQFSIAVSYSFGGKNVKATLNETSTHVIGSVLKVKQQQVQPNPGPVVDNRTDEQVLLDQIVANEEANAPTVEQDMQSGHVDQNTMANLNYGNMTYEGNTETMAEQINNYAPAPEAPAVEDANAPGNNPLANNNDVNLDVNANMGTFIWTKD